MGEKVVQHLRDPHFLELKARLREYERQGVQATLEMRQAARRVALENSRLRSLLASRGVKGEDVDQYLASFSSPASGVLPATSPASQTGKIDSPFPVPDSVSSRHGMVSGTLCDLQTTNISNDTKTGWATPQQIPDAGDAGSTTVPGGDVERLEGEHYQCGSAPTSALNTLAAVADASVWQTCCGSVTQCSSPDVLDAQGPGAEPPLCDGMASSLPGIKSSGNMNSHLEMSCTAAAHIMANFFRDKDEERAREVLGCTGSNECVVRNTHLLQLLDSPERV
ncbi:hypothetical protein MMYC01_209039 [Madurella mycetomatis]|uniref:Uncharacterized protein n=1 Tax=Madurella mycetomatis TaxID=100816 RepID=A0A175VTP2_9PEZI|nr:hypothetical protein MMYC01_209039 [Madurella mycetomatis]